MIDARRADVGLEAAPMRVSVRRAALASET
jgi:hypothetical protein